MDRRTRLIEIFEDTQKFYNTDPALISAVNASKAGTRLYDVGATISFPEVMEKTGEITVTRSKTFEAAMRLSKKYYGKKIAVLNFASASNPGGGVTHGSSAQEESLCRCSTLYPTLTQGFLWNHYYTVNRANGDVLHTDACIYSPDIVICKTDSDYPERMEQKDWCTVDVITCAAPNLRNEPANLYNLENGEPVCILPDELREIHEKRARQILAVAAENRVDILVLGAFGCGAFRNDPKVVAKAYRNVLAEYGKCFDLVEFAIYCRDYETENYDAFRYVFAKE